MANFSARELALPTDFDWHIHMPSHNLKLSGSSNRLALAYGVLSLLTEDELVPPDQIVLSGDMTLKGAVLPVKYVAQKIAAWQESGLPLALFSAQHSLPERHGLHLISGLRDLLQVTRSPLIPARCVISAELRRFGYGAACI
jgi:predicted ATP-dependent serine protease